MDDLHLQKVLKGDTEAFRYFVEQYKEMAYKMAISITKEEFSAKDVVQESFILAFRKLHTFRGKAKFSTWFARIVINQALKASKVDAVSETREYTDQESSEEGTMPGFYSSTQQC